MAGKASGGRLPKGNNNGMNSYVVEDSESEQRLGEAGQLSRSQSGYEDVVPGYAQQGQQGQGQYPQQARQKEAEAYFVDEVGSAPVQSEYSAFGQESEEDQDLTSHMSVRSPVRGAFSETDEAAAVEAAAEGTEFEHVEGWQEPQYNEAGAEQPLVEAYYASADREEFFPALGALLLPVAKAVLPALAGAVVQQGSRVLQPRLASIFQRLQQLGINPATLARKEYDGGAEAGFDEATLATIEQQIEALEVIIGRDDRVQIRQTASIPWSRVCQLRIKAANGKSFLGTGFLIGPRTIVTAGHCVYLHGQGGWAREIQITPGCNGAQAPFGRFNATNFRSVRGWVTNQSRNYDYGCIILPREANIPSSVGSFGFSALSDQALTGKKLNIAGYPGDKPSGTMWYHGRRATSVKPRVISYDIDTMGGQSGSPVWLHREDGKRVVVGIHTNGAPSGNSATRITQPVFENLKRWRQE